MKNNKSTKLRILILLNLISIPALIILYEILLTVSDKMPWIIAPGLVIILLAVSFYWGIWKPGFWRRTHASDKQLDEREIHENYKILKLSYSIFSICILLIIYLYYFIDLRIGVLPAALAIYFAHALPAYIFGWRNGIMPRQD